MELQAEKELVEKAKTDPLAFGELYDLYYPKIFNYALRRLGEAALAADITSEVFFKVMKNLVKFEWQSIPFSSWIYKIASNEINTHFRKKRFWFLSLETLFEKPGFEVADEDDLQEDYIQAQKQLERYEDFRQVQKLLKKLSPKYQEVLVLRFFENKKIREISEITGKNENTVKSLLARGLEKLRSQAVQGKGGENRLLESNLFRR
ncbi:MAG: sigma-70 family RNA polymerase sigma factor [Chloroflexota bacterium]